MMQILIGKRSKQTINGFSYIYYLKDKEFGFEHQFLRDMLHLHKGKLLVDSTSRLNLGMVTDAIWTDYDNDGWEDLLVAREWNSLVILKNMAGKELVPQNIPGLEGHHGIWYSLVARDFDLDGDDDYIADNLGENNRFNASDKYPLNLYAIDLVLDGTMASFSTLTL